jgi:hypothetical protein
MTDEEWTTLAEAADILEQYGHHEASVTVFAITQQTKE